MGRKKKETNTLYGVTNNLRSKGNVKIKVYNGNKLFNTIEKHNTGTVDLCKYVRDVMVGLGTSVDQPTVIKPCTLNGGVLTPISNQGVPFVSRWRGGESSTDAVAVIKFVIPWTQLSIGKKINGFQLFNKNDLMYAYVKLDDPGIEISASTNIEVEWSLKISYMIN